MLEGMRVALHCWAILIASIVAIISGLMCMLSAEGGHTLQHPSPSSFKEASSYASHDHMDPSFLELW